MNFHDDLIPKQSLEAFGGHRCRYGLDPNHQPPRQMSDTPSPIRIVLLIKEYRKIKIRKHLQWSSFYSCSSSVITGHCVIKNIFKINTHIMQVSCMHRSCGDHQRCPLVSSRVQLPSWPLPPVPHNQAEWVVLERFDLYSPYILMSIPFTANWCISRAKRIKSMCHVECRCFGVACFLMDCWFNTELDEMNAFEQCVRHSVLFTSTMVNICSPQESQNVDVRIQR